MLYALYTYIHTTYVHIYTSTRTWPIGAITQSQSHPTYRSGYLPTDVYRVYLYYVYVTLYTRRPIYLVAFSLIQIIVRHLYGRTYLPRRPTRIYYESQMRIARAELLRYFLKFHFRWEDAQVEWNGSMNVIWDGDDRLHGPTRDAYFTYCAKIGRSYWLLLVERFDRVIDMYDRTRSR